MRASIRSLVESIDPFDEVEEKTKCSVLSWIDSGAELCRLKKPDTPPRHLVSYFVVVDQDHILLVDHINAQLWLPTGGHVEPGEDPTFTVRREAKEELSIDAEFLRSGSLFLTETRTLGRTSGHTDVSLWFILHGDRSHVYAFDRSEFNDIQWFDRQSVPLGKSDPHMARFLHKLYG